MSEHRSEQWPTPEDSPVGDPPSLTPDAISARPPAGDVPEATPRPAGRRSSARGSDTPRRSRQDRQSGEARQPRARGGWDRLRLLMLALSLGLLFWSLTPLIAVDGLSVPSLIKLVIASASGASLLVTAGALVLGTWAARRHSWESVAIVAVAGLIPWAFVTPYVMSNQPTGTAAPDAAKNAGIPLRVMLVNANQGNASPEDITATAQANNVDVVVVTELTTELAHDLTVTGLSRQLTAGWVKLPGEQGVNASPEAGTGVWTRAVNPVAQDIAGTRWPAVRLTMPLEQGEVGIVAGHVDSPLSGVEAWARDLRLLREGAAGSGPRLILANLNATTWNADLRDYKSFGLHDAADVLGQGPRPTWPTWSPFPLLALDHVMVSDTVRVEQVQGVEIDGSDHRGLVVGLVLPSS